MSGIGWLYREYFGLACSRYRVVECTGSLSYSGITLVPNSSIISNTSSCSTPSGAIENTTWSQPTSW